MSDSITISTTDGGGNGIVNSIVGVLFGVVMFFGSFVLLWWNEGNVIAEKEALDEIGAKLVKADANKPDPKHNGKLVYMSAKLTSPDRLGDEPYLVGGPYLKLERRIEMYQWVETEETRRVGKRRETTYKYAMGWAEGRQNSEMFKLPAGHTNPPLAIKPVGLHVKKASFGKLDGVSVIKRLDATTEVAVTAPHLSPKIRDKKPELKGGMVYLRKTPGTKVDTLGDVRLSYRALKPGNFSLIAKLQGKQLVGHVTSNGREKFIVESGTKSPDSLIKAEKAAASSMAMVLRFAGFFIMWIGMNLMAGPLTMVLSFIPIIGTLGRFMLGIVFFVAALVLSVATILISMVAHHPVLLVLLLLAGGGAAFYYKKNKGAGSYPSSRGQSGGSRRGAGGGDGSAIAA